MTDDGTPIDASTDLSEPALAAWGWSDTHRGWWQSLPIETRSASEPGRVVKELRGVLEVETAGGRIDTRIPGRWFQRSARDAIIPTVGDWVLVPRERPPGDCWIQSVMPRRSKFSRHASGLQTREQVVAANIDDVFIVVGLDGDFNLRRLERYLAAAHDSGATPVVLFNKADLCEDLEEVREHASLALGDTPYFFLSSEPETAQYIRELDLSGIDELQPRLVPGRTIAFVGSSGVGKSTLVNRLFGTDVMRVQEVRARDDRGQHTTSHRELHRLPQGCLLIDNPGVRELQGWQVDEGLEAAFEEIRTVAEHCRFRDCRHDAEPGCAVQEAVRSGQLSQKRVEHYRKLEQESEDQESRRSERERNQESLVARGKRERNRGRGRARRRSSRAKGSTSDPEDWLD